MKKPISVCLLTLSMVFGSLLVKPRWAIGETWAQWRGPLSNNHAAENTRIPRNWDLESGQNIVWKTQLPGRGHSTPVFTESYVFVTTADAQAETQSLLKLDRDTGKLLDNWVIHQGTLPNRIHPHNSHASPSPAIVEDAVLVSFYTNNSIVLSKVTLDGQIIWQKRVSEFDPASYQFGYGASPIVEGELVYVAAEYDGDESGLYALDVGSGKQIWKAARPSNLNFASPILATIAGQQQLILAGAETITSYDPQTGREFWSAGAGTEAHCGTVVWDDRRVIASGGNPAAKTWCVSGDGKETVIWENNTLAYEQSLLTIPNYVFAVADSGVAHCWKTQDGTEMWKRTFVWTWRQRVALACRQYHCGGQRTRRRGSVFGIAESFRLDCRNQNRRFHLCLPRCDRRSVVFANRCRVRVMSVKEVLVAIGE